MCIYFVNQNDVVLIFLNIKLYSYIKGFISLILFNRIILYSISNILTDCN